MSDEKKVRELVERIQRLAEKEREVDARMKKLERLLAKKVEQ